MAQQPFRHFLGPCVTWLQGLEIALFSLKPIEPVKWLAFGQSPIGFVAQTPGSVWRKVGWVRSLSQGEDSLPRTCDPTNTLLCKGSAYICNPPPPKKKHANFFEFPNYMSSLLNLGLWLSDDSCFYDFYVTLGVAFKEHLTPSPAPSPWDVSAAPNQRSRRWCSQPSGTGTMQHRSAKPPLAAPHWAPHARRRPFRWGWTNWRILQVLGIPLDPQTFRKPPNMKTW